MREFLKRIAPMVAGKNDPRVPCERQSEQIAGALKKAGTPVWYILANE
jgi:dipeptidyl aminopeptidase/acylaminoacyl peptidase